MDKFDMMEKLIENLGVKETLTELVHALSDDDMKENYEYICRMNGIDNETEEEEELEDIEFDEELDAIDLDAIEDIDFSDIEEALKD